MKPESFVALNLSESFSYPHSPFDPPEVYPEFSRHSFFGNDKETNKGNEAYRQVRNLLKALGLDSKNFASARWNPLGEFLEGGEKIVIKPNLVYDKHPLGEAGLIATITHASVIRPLVDYTLLATGCNCEITICDVPLQTASWNRLIKSSGLLDLVNFYKAKGIKIRLFDLRREISTLKNGIIVERIIEDRDPKGYGAVDLGKKSELMPVIEHCKRLMITDYGRGVVPKHHNEEKNEYLVPKTILEADFFINVPKLKTHKKAGITCAMKNLIGINGDKSWIAHHRSGKAGCGGDEYRELNPKVWLACRTWDFLKSHQSLHSMAEFGRKTYQKHLMKGRSLDKAHIEGEGLSMEGSWYGNDTLWRCIKDINKIALYADKNGVMKEEKQRKCLCLVEGIISAEGEGPMHGMPKKTGILLGGTNFVAVDKICADIMGFDYRKIPSVRQGFVNNFWPLVDFSPEKIKTNLKPLPDFNFKPSKGWQSHIER